MCRRLLAKGVQPIVEYFLVGTSALNFLAKLFAHPLPLFLVAIGLELAQQYVGGQLQRSQKPQQLRGLNQNHNHAMKEIFKGAATRATCGPGPFRDFYAALLAKGMKPEMARLTLARKIAANYFDTLEKGGTFRR